MFLFIYELLIIDFVRTDTCILNQAQLQVNFFFLVVLITITLLLQFVCIYMCQTVVCGVTHMEHALYNSVLLSKL